MVTKCYSFPKSAEKWLQVICVLCGISYKDKKTSMYLHELCVLKVGHTPNGRSARKY